MDEWTPCCYRQLSCAYSGTQRSWAVANDVRDILFFFTNLLVILAVTIQVGYLRSASIVMCLLHCGAPRIDTHFCCDGGT